MNLNTFTWVDFYEELAGNLLPYSDNRAALIEKIRSVFSSTGINMPTLEKDNNPTDIDPFTVFGLFNKGLTDEKRTRLAEGFRAEFAVNAEPPHDFSGIPVLNNMAATFYRFYDERGEQDIDNIWRIYQVAINFADAESDETRQQFVAAYDTVRMQKGIRWNLTMGLYWMRPKAYISLDSRNRDYFLHKYKDVIPEIIKPMSNNVLPDAQTYLTIRDAFSGAFKDGSIPYRDFPDFSYTAWLKTQEMTKDEQWMPEGYSPAISVEDWKKLLSDKDIFNASSLAIMKRMKDYGGIATCSQLAEKYGEVANFYNSGSVALARRIVDKTQCPVSEREDGSVQWWAILYEGQNADKDDVGTFIWKLRDELAEALTYAELDSVPLYVDRGSGEIRYWLYAPGHGAEKWDEFYSSGIMGLGWDDIGDLAAYDTKADMIEEMKIAYGTEKKHTNSAYATWQFSHEIKPGDVVFVKRGRGGDILGRGVVKSGYRYDDSRSEYKNVIPVEWTHKGAWKIDTDKQLPMKTLTDITSYSGMVAKIRDLFEDEETEEMPDIQYETYTADDFLREVYMSREQYRSLVGLLKRKKNIILEGAPGVGKTFAAKRLAYSLMGVKDKERVTMVQFHQSYSYEDFIMGHRPTENGFALQTGPFYEFCAKARDDRDNEYYFIIDEINRGNLSKIFGELFMLIEADKRNEEIRLLYEDELFSVPDNLYIIGMMNTADRSLAFLDYALRRRFSFYRMNPSFDTAGFKEYQASLGEANTETGRKFDRMINCIKGLNQTIADDEALGDGFSVGHSYFCGLKPQDIEHGELASIVEYEIIPLIKEYWFDEPSKVEEWTASLRSALQ